MQMTRNALFSSAFFLFTCIVTLGQSGPAPSGVAANGQGGAPVSYVSVTQVNAMLSELQDASTKTQSVLQKLRIEKWKADGSYKKQALGNAESIERNLQGALPEIIAQLR